MSRARLATLYVGELTIAYSKAAFLPKILYLT